MQTNVSGLGAFSFVEAAILLVAVAVLFLVWTRSQKKGFHLPGGDGVAIVMAGGWAMLLLVWRLFDKPNIQGAGALIGIQWGIFAAMVAAGALIAAGLRVRTITRPSRPTRPPTTPMGRGAAAPRTERARTASRATPPPSPSCCATARRGRAKPRTPPTTRLDEAPTTRLPEDPSEAPTRRERRPETTERPMGGRPAR